MEEASADAACIFARSGRVSAMITTYLTDDGRLRPGRADPLDPDGVSVTAVGFLPPTLIASIYGMNRARS